MKIEPYVPVTEAPTDPVALLAAPATTPTTLLVSPASTSVSFTRTFPVAALPAVAFAIPPASIAAPESSMPVGVSFTPSMVIETCVVDSKPFASRMV